MFILANRVMAHPYLGPSEKKAVLELIEIVIMYDHGYQKVKGVEDLPERGRSASMMPSSPERTSTR